MKRFKKFWEKYVRLKSPTFLDIMKYGYDLRNCEEITESKLKNMGIHYAKRHTILNVIQKFV